MAQKVYRDTVFGPAVHPHILTPDSKFSPDNPLFKTGLRLTGAEAQSLKTMVDAAAQEAYDEFMSRGDGANLTPGEKKKFTVYFPYEEEEDEEGNKNGSIVFNFKQNQRIRLKDGTVKNIEIGIYDAAGKPMKKEVGAGSIIRINYSMRPIPMKSLKQVGVRLDFSRIQVKEYQAPGRGGFGAVDGGYEDDGHADEGGFGAADGHVEGTAQTNADY